MHDETDVRFVDSHPEGDRRAYHPHVVAQEHFLVLRALFRFQSGVIRLRHDAVCVQLCGHGIGHLAARAIDDPAVVRPVLQELEQLIVGRRLRHDPVSQVRPVETGDVAPRVVQFQLLQDIVPHPLGRGRGQGHDRNVWQYLPQPGQLAIFRPEIVAPFADAMRFVDRDLRDFPLFHLLDERLEHESLRRDVEEAELAVVQVRAAASAPACHRARNSKTSPPPRSPGAHRPGLS